MPRLYRNELAALPHTYIRARELDITPVRELVTDIAGGPAVFVGSGGAQATAQLAADLHRRYASQSASATTPLGLMATQRLSYDTPVVVFSAGGRNSDTFAALSAAVRLEVCRVTLVTSQQRGRLRKGITDLPIDTIHLPRFGGRDGFLATNSVLTTATALIRAYSGPGGRHPETVTVTPDDSPLLKPRVLVLVDPGHGAIGADIEARINETGLASAVVADYRNIAHGRHVWLERDTDATSVVAISGPEYDDLAEATLRLLPPVDVIRLKSDYVWPGSVVDLLVQSMQLIEPSARAEGIEPANPGVAEFGKKLYRLDAARFVRPQNLDPVDRKLLALGGLDDGDLRKDYARWLEKWISDTQSASIAGLVLDYDGTCCTTAGRFELPLEPIREQILRLLAQGCVVGFASGRGGSLPKDLREWIPSANAGQIHIGLYNGGHMMRLDDQAPPRESPQGDLAEFVERLEAVSINRLLVEARRRQVTVTTEPGSAITRANLDELMESIISRSPTLGLKVIRSGHSLDVVEKETSKLSVLAAVRAQAAGHVMSIGDQGQKGGNDFELLSADTMTLTVNRCSADPTRCWNLDRNGRSGPDLLVRYLAALVHHDGMFNFDTKTI